MKKSLILLLAIFMLGIDICTARTVTVSRPYNPYGVGIYNPGIMGYTSANGLRRELANIEYNIQQNNKRINAIRNSSGLSNYQKNMQIRRLQSQIYNQRRNAARIRSSYRRAIW